MVVCSKVRNMILYGIEIIKYLNNKMKVIQPKHEFLRDRRGSLNTGKGHKIMIRGSSTNFVSCLTPPGKGLPKPIFSEDKAKKLKLRLPNGIFPSTPNQPKAEPKMIKSILLRNNIVKNESSAPPFKSQAAKKRSYVSNLIKDIIKGGVLSFPARSNKGTPVQSPRRPSEKEFSLDTRKKSCASPTPLILSHQGPSLSGGDIIRIEDSGKVLRFHSRKSSVQDFGEKRSPAVSLKGLKSILNTRTGSTAEGSSNGSFVKFNDPISQERDQLISFNKACIFIYHNHTIDYRKTREIPPTSLEYYKFIKLIGKGAFGKVTLGLHKLTGKYVAIKSIDKECLKDDFSKKKVLREIYILKKIKHANVIRLLEVFETPKHVLIVMEYAGGGDLLHCVKQHKRLTEEQAMPIFRQVVYGLAHIHSRNILHRDIKLDNILIDSEGGVKICDFGVSKIIDKNITIYDQCGTPAYIAPEIITEVGYKGFYVDHWSLGILLYAMLCGTVPFKAGNMKDLHALIKKGAFDFPVNISEEAKDLIRSLIRLKPEERLSIPEILNHPWLNQNESFKSAEDHKYFVEREDCINEHQEESLQPSINNLNIDNIFFPSKPHVKLGFQDYCYVANDFYTHHLDEEALKVVEGFGYNREKLVDSLNRGELNHATASYNLLTLN